MVHHRLDAFLDKTLNIIFHICEALDHVMGPHYISPFIRCFILVWLNLATSIADLILSLSAYFEFLYHISGLAQVDQAEETLSGVIFVILVDGFFDFIFGFFGVA